MSEEETAAPAAPPQASVELARKAPPEMLTLRGMPRRVVRFKRSAIVGGAATGAIVISGVAWLALGHHPLHVALPVDQQETDRHAPADAVANLPGDYSKVPQLGPPLPGDLGRPILERQQEVAGQGGPAVQTAEQQRAEAERQRIAQQAAQAREAGVMVQSSQRPTTLAVGGAGAAAAATATASEQGDKLALDPERDQNGQQRKFDFVSRSSADSIYDGHTLQTPASPFEFATGFWPTPLAETCGAVPVRYNPEVVGKEVGFSLVL